MKILIIDDAKDVRRIIKFLFEKKYGIDVYEADNGHDGFELAYVLQPDLILLDFIMPVMDGRETLEKILSDPRTKMLPVVMLTSKESKEETRRMMQMGAKGWISKMVPATELTEHIYRKLTEITTSPY